MVGSGNSMKHEWDKVKGKLTGRELPGLSCIHCGVKMFGGNVTNVCHKRVELGLREEVKKEVKGEK